MRKGMGVLALAAAALATLVPAGAQAQHRLIAAWDAPSFMSPGPHDDIGFYYVKPSDTDGGLAVTWRQSGRVGLGVRGEYIHDIFGAHWGIGAEIKGGLGQVAPPLAFNWTAGVGALVGSGESDLRIPVGLTIGLRLASGDLVLTPYVHPRVSLAYVSFDNGGSDSALQFDTDVGADLQLTPEIILRFGGTFGDQPAVGAGLALRLGRF